MPTERSGKKTVAQKAAEAAQRRKELAKQKRAEMAALRDGDPMKKTGERAEDDVERDDSKL